MNMLERLAREIEPLAWQRLDDAQRPYIEGRGPDSEAGSGSEDHWYAITSRLGFTTAEEVGQWFLKDAEPRSVSQSMAKARDSLQKARVVVEILTPPCTWENCPLCKMQREIDEMKAVRHTEHVEIGSVLILEEPDRTVVSIYKPLTADHRRQMLDLMRSIENSHAEDCENG
ncbi:hypothetical protein [Pseudosulfitobacter pseudonitzschiae]|uniref:hypothetical protein n=1 Tax=Pseudosulfitobacter pseudonitzschiae TaxID=1402135 RepID=UPI003B7F5529